jgi:hypothetical protein
MVQLFVPTSRTISARNVIIGTILVVATATLVLTLLSALGLVNMCKAGKARSGAKKRGGGTKAQAAQAAQAAQGQSGGRSLVERDAKEAVAEVRGAGRDKIIYVLGQMSCPACQACKKYMAENGYGDDAVFVDLMQNGEMLKDGSLPKPVVQSLGRGVPCLVAFSHRAGAALKKHEGFSPKSVDELVTMVRS